MNNQNSNKNIRLIKAYRNEYSNAKIFVGIQTLLALFSVILTFLAIYNQNYRPIFSIISFIFLIIDFFILQNLIKKFREEGAKLQETFDCKVLNLQLNQLKFGDSSKEEDILFASKKYSVEDKDIKDWYNSQVLSLPTPYKELLSIRSSIYWDDYLRKKFIYLIFLLFAIIIAIAITCAIIYNNKFIESIALLFAPLAPFLVLCYKNITENRDICKKLDKLYNHVNKLLIKAKEGTIDFTEEIRNLQDEIFDGRKRNILIPDFWHHRLKDRISKNLNEILEEEIDEINQILKK